MVTPSEQSCCKDQDWVPLGTSMVPTGLVKGSEKRCWLFSGRLWKPVGAGSEFGKDLASLSGRLRRPWMEAGDLAETSLLPWVPLPCC